MTSQVSLPSLATVTPDSSLNTHTLRTTKLNETSGLSYSKELPSIKDLFPVIPNENGSSQQQQQQPQVTASTQSSGVSGKSFSQPISIQVPVQQQPIALELEMSKLTQLTLEIQSLINNYNSFRAVPRELLDAGFTHLNLLNSLYHIWSSRREQELAMDSFSPTQLAPSPPLHSPLFTFPNQSQVPTSLPQQLTVVQTVQAPVMVANSKLHNVEEQAARTLSSMVEDSEAKKSLGHRRFASDSVINHHERPTTPPISPTSLAFKKLKLKKSPGGTASVTVADSSADTTTNFPNLSNVLGSSGISLSRSDMACLHCMSRETPEWRRGPSGERTLCNACGLFYAKLCKKYGEDQAKVVMRDRKVNGSETDRRVSIGS